MLVLKFLEIIAKSELLNENETISQYDAVRIANFIYDINSSDISLINKWSMRDVRKIFRRISDYVINPKNF